MMPTGVLCAHKEIYSKGSLWSLSMNADIFWAQEVFELFWVVGVLLCGLGSLPFVCVWFCFLISCLKTNSYPETPPCHQPLMQQILIHILTHKRYISAGYSPTDIPAVGYFRLLLLTLKSVPYFFIQYRLLTPGRKSTFPLRPSKAALLELHQGYTAFMTKNQTAMRFNISIFP